MLLRRDRSSSWRLVATRSSNKLRVVAELPANTNGGGGGGGGTSVVLVSSAKALVDGDFQWCGSASSSAALTTIADACFDE